MDYANGRCTANNGDVVFVQAGHTETVTAAAGLDLDVAGVTLGGESACSIPLPIQAWRNSMKGTAKVSKDQQVLKVDTRLPRPTPKLNKGQTGRVVSG